MIGKKSKEKQRWTEKEIQSNTGRTEHTMKFECHTEHTV